MLKVLEGNSSESTASTEWVNENYFYQFIYTHEVNENSFLQFIDTHEIMFAKKQDLALNCP